MPGPVPHELPGLIRAPGPLPQVVLPGTKLVSTEEFMKPLSLPSGLPVIATTGPNLPPIEIPERFRDRIRAVSTWTHDFKKIPENSSKKG